MNADNINHRPNKLTNVRKTTQDRIAESEGVLQSVDNKIADFERRQQQRLASDGRVPNKVAENITQKIPADNMTVSVVVIDEKEFAVEEAYWCSDEKLVVKVREDLLAEIKTFAYRSNLKGGFDGHNFEGWISMLLSSGHLEFHKVSNLP